MYKLISKKKVTVVNIAKYFLSLTLLIGVIFPVSAQNQTVTMPQSNTTISEALKSLQDQTGYKFTWDRQFDVSKSITLPASSTSFSSVMEAILKGSDRTYSVHNNYVLIKIPTAIESGQNSVTVPREEQVVAKPVEVKQVEGRVTLEGSSKSIYNAVITLDSDTSDPFVTTTDTKGYFELTNIPLGAYTLTVSHLDYGSTGMTITVDKGVDHDLYISMPIAVETPNYIQPKSSAAAISSEAVLGKSKPLFNQRQPLVALKTNLIHDAFTTINLGVEVRLGQSLTLDIPFSVNQWKGGKRMNILMVQPELRWWTAEPFNGHFFGVHAHYAHFGVGNIDIPLGIWDAAKNYHFQGDLYGIGLSYGYQWILSNRLNLEVNIGLGYFYAEYDKYSCGSCNTIVEKGAAKHYFGPTKAGISLVYILK